MTSSEASEGEIVEMEVDKAPTDQPAMKDTRIDRQSRPTSASTSPGDSAAGSHERYRSRSRSPYRHRSPRGEKRRREDDYGAGDRERHDPRRFKVRYDVASGRRHGNDDDRRHRVSYADIDRDDPTRYSIHDDHQQSRDRNRDRRHRTRSRSPPRAFDGRHGNLRSADGRSSGHGRRSSPRRKGNNDRRRPDSSNLRNGERNAREQDCEGDSSSKKNAEPNRPYHTPQSEGMKDQSSREETSKHDTEEPINYESTELDEAAQIELRRKRREALKAKLKAQPTPLLVQVLHLGSSESGASTPKPDSQTPREPGSLSPAPGSPRSQSGGADAADSPSAFAVEDDQELANHNQTAGAVEDAEGPSAADYDPTMDMQEDRARQDLRLHSSDMPANGYDETNSEQQDLNSIPQNVAEAKPVKEDEFDMFADDDDDDDMFAPDPIAKRASKPATAKAKELDMSLLDNWDDPDGYYRIIIGELIDGRYHVQANLGKGMFSAVVRAMDDRTNKLVAIKIIRNNETMKKAGLKEIEILQKLSAADPDDRKHLIRLERQFEHKGHLCMVFENLSINLREVLKKFGRDVGINLKAVRSYAQQMFLGLSLLRKCNVLHADLKPDNVLVNESRNLLKICDLGSAGDASENEITPYLVSRFYRAPEIILGMPYDFGIDTWSIGCTLFELYTGKILFTGRNNNQMLRSIMECRGKFTLKMLKKAEFAGLHFDDKLMFRSVEKDKVTGKDVVRWLNFLKPTRDLKTRLMSTSKGLNEAEMKELNLFVDLLDRCLALNPERRITPSEALKHPFIHRSKI